MTATLALAGILCLAGGAVAAQDYPTRPIKFVVPFAAGGMDLEIRALQPDLEKLLGQPIVVEPREGGGSSIGANYVKASAPDGYTLLYSSSIVLTVGPLVRKVPYTFEDFVPVAQATATANVLAARADAPFKTLAELTAYAKANPGKVMFGSSGTGTTVHLSGQLVADRLGIQINHIPFDGVAKSVAAAVGGNIDYVIGIPVGIIPQVDAGKMRALAQLSAVRSLALPDLPTLKDQGLDLAVDANTGVFAPKGVPEAAIQRLTAAFKIAVEAPSFREYGMKRWTVPVYRDPAAFTAAIVPERTLFRDVIKGLQQN